MKDLTDRQKQLLKAIVEVYVKSGEPVGSEHVDKAYSLGVSPATIRNEMAKLTELGYLKQPHTSAGRIPTTAGFRIYISELMKEKDLPISAEVSIKEKLWQQRAQVDHLYREAVHSLANRCQMLALAMSDNGEFYYSGAANILDFPEFEDIEVARFVLSLFDEYPTLEQIIGKAVERDPLMSILFGDELGYDYLQPTAFAFSKFAGRGGKEGVVGVIGPARMNFPVVIPYVRFVSNTLQQALKEY